MTTLQNFTTLPFIKALKAFFEDLHIPINYLSDLPARPSAIFGDAYNAQNLAHALINEVFVLGTVDDKAFDQTKIITENDIKNADYDFLLIIGMTLKNAKLPTRGQLAELTRLANKIFNTNQKGNPITVVFRYDDCISFSNAERVSRNENDYREGEKLRKVSCLKDIKLTNTHAAHQRILLELAKPPTIPSFEGLYEHWRKVFDTKELNKSFFKKIANWYFWAIAQSKFPYEYLRNDEKHTAKTDDELQNLANQKALIRFITRIVFVWFLKEKKLVPDTLFDEDFLKKTLENFETENTSDYYNAILQNLFFATLNRTKDQRAFATDEGFNKNKGNYDVNSLYRYEKMFRDVNPEQIMGIFADIPFLNGGLFDSLDNKENALLMDGFSRNPKRQAIMPDRLFFATKIEDFDQKLNEIYDTRSKRYELKGLFAIFNEYKFTVEENTPLEIDVALDPYLLGEIFENLLAYYNPETGTTARKGSGSFYTPQEIVNYMVDESLKAYLQNQLPDLTTFNNLSQLNDQQKYDFVKKLSEVKILDPACGSGAFPMGVLYKMVDLLKQIDPQNSIWKQTQHDKIIGKKIAELEADKKAILGLSDVQVRDKAAAAVEDRLQELESIFNNEYNFDDYARKLFIIQNCIYGVDIQDVAIQISKLRFFLSLIIDQKNEAIKPLPNLETKFVIANTLIGLEKPKAQTGNIFTNEIQLEVEVLGEKLKKLRSQYFDLRNRKEKQALQKTDKELRATIAQKLQSIGYDAKNAGKIATWDIYDQNATADWFDMNWMFGISDGFDVVIGNPPYFSLSTISKEEQNYFSKSQFETYSKGADIYCLFFEKGFQLLNKSGILGYITSNRFCFTNYGIDTRAYLSNKNILKVINFNGLDVFESANVGSIISVIQNTTPNDDLIIALDFVDKEINQDLGTIIKNKAVNIEKQYFGKSQWSFEDNKILKLKLKIESKGVPFINWKDIKINRGVTTGANDIFIINNDTKKALCLEYVNSSEIIKPLLKGKNVKRYNASWSNEWIIFTRRGIDINKFPAIRNYLENYKKELEPGVGRKAGNYKWYEIQDNTAYFNEFEKKKLIWSRLSNINPFAISTNKEFSLDSTSFAVTKDAEYLCAILNSKLVLFYFKLGSVIWGKDGIKWFGEYFDNIPIPEISPEAQAPFIALVDKILAIKKGEKEGFALSEAFLKTAAASKSEKKNEVFLNTTSELEAEIDLRVYKLYELTHAEVLVIDPNLGMSAGEYELWEG